MSAPDTCRAFRARLERALEGRPLPSELQELSWHAHLVACATCRELLQREEALEELLATLPVPRLPRALAERVLARLRSNEDSLDELLALDEGAGAPSGLVERVLAGVRTARAEPLDALLELDRPLEVPQGLASRVLDALESERRPVRRRLVLVRRRRLLLAAAAVATFALLPFFLEEPAPPVRFTTPELVARSDEALRAFLQQGGLELLEEPLLWAPDDDIELALATSLDPRYEVVLDYERDESAEGGR